MIQKEKNENNKDNQKVQVTVKTKRKLLFSFTGIIFVIILFLIFGKTFFPCIPFGMNCSNLFNREPIIQSSIVLEYIKDIYEFSTIEYVYKTVFPYDFYDPERITKLLIKTSSYSANELKEINEYNEFFKIYPKIKSIIILKTFVRAGFEIPKEILDPSKIPLKDITKYIKIIKEEDGLTISLRLPKTKITEIVIDDNYQAYGKYLEADFTPEILKKISTLLKPKIEDLSIKEGILEKAEKNAKDFISEFLIMLGFKKVVYMTD